MMNSEHETFKIINAQIVTPFQLIRNGTVLVRHGLIEVVTEGFLEIPEAKTIDAKGMFIAPGLIDNQVNGFAGVSFSLGGSDLTEEGIARATRELWKTGVTTYLPTLTTNSQKMMLNNLRILNKAMANEELAGSIPGFHLEGPYINPEDGYRGAHPIQFVRLPEWVEFLELYEASGRHILQITLAPEMAGALDFISRCDEMGVVIALGHHNAPTEIVTAAIDRGAKIATHLGNGAANMINRHNNPFWSQLADDRLHISIICDSFHLLPEEIRVFYKVKGVAKIILTSDVTSFATLEPGMYQTQTGETIELREDGLLHYPAQKCLYGSASPLTKSIEYIVQVTDCSLAEAIQMASSNTAKLLGLNDRGKVEPGLRADLILFSLEYSKISIHKTFVKGKIVYESSY
jgi:N-acetylglucosamine-6-phosphate deacetylase